VDPPVVEIIAPAKDTAVTIGEQELRARITSSALLNTVTLIREGSSPFAKQIPLADLKRDARNVYEVKVNVDLVAGGNSLRLEAINDGGKGEDALVVTYLKTPVRLEIKYLYPKGNAGQENRIEPTPVPNGNGKLIFKGVPVADCVVRGFVYWDKEKDDQLRGILPVEVRAYVNGKRQRSALLSAAAAGERRRAFEVDVLLTESANNVIEIELPELAQEASNPSELHADCGKPRGEQFGHLLIIGTGKTKEKALIDKALQAIQGEDTKEEVKGLKVFRAAAFRRGYIYPPLIGATITPDKVLTQLQSIRREINNHAGLGSANDVLLVYYEGNEAVTAEGHFLRTDRSRYDDDLKTSALTVDRLEHFCANTMGAQVLLLDVARDESIRAAASVEDKDEVLKRPGRTHVSVFRCLTLLDHLDAPSNPVLLASWQQATKTHVRLGDVGTDIVGLIKQPRLSLAIPKTSGVLPVGAAGPGG
jgi:hypothetical protein